MIEKVLDQTECGAVRKASDISLELSHGVTIALKSKLLCLRIWLIVIAKSFVII